MALQVWLPLNGTLENKGLSNVTVTNSGATVDNNGKIGKCYTYTTTLYMEITNLSFSSLSSCSISFWLKVTTRGNSGWLPFTGQTVYHYIMATAQGTGAFYHGNAGSGQKIYKDGVLSTTPGALNEWHHYVITGVDLSSWTKFYINKYSNGWDFAGSINDLRIYNHVLSEKEVKEISKGLILHYKLDGNDIGITIPRNGGLIPDGVELYDYILSSGTLWIDTGYAVNSTNGRKIKMEIDGNFGTSSTDTGGGWALDGSAYPNYHCYLGLNGLKKIAYGNSADTITTYTENDLTGRHLYSIDYISGTILRDGVSITTFTPNTSQYTKQHNILIYGWAETRGWQVNAKKYRFSLWDNNILVRNMLPCTYLGEPGMWDTVENKFYRNQGTGLFTLGNKITLKEYEYLLNDTNSWINTGVISTSNTNFDLEMSWNGNTKQDVFFGCSTLSGYANGYNFSMDKELNGHLIYTCMKGYQNSNINVSVDTKYKFVLNNNVISINGSSYNVTKSSIPNLSIYLFSRNINNMANPSSDTYTNKEAKKLYYCKLYDGSILVRDFIPVSYNGTPGLWDKVEWKFYANAGSGSFTLGPEVTVQQDAPIFYDSSGYCNHGSITGTLTTNSDSPRYTASTVFNGGNNHVASPSIGKEGFKNSFTVSWWSKTSNMNGRMAWGSSGNGLNLYPSGSYFCWNTGDGVANTIGTVTWATYNDGNWHHYVMTGDGTTGKLYIDGEHKGNAKTYKPLSYPIIYVSGWDTSNSYVWNGNISDFRIYCTALSEDDIKELYNTSAFITNNGVFAEYELYEDNLSDVKKTGLLETANFYENGAESGYALDTDKTRVASNYIISEEFIEI